MGGETHGPDPIQVLRQQRDVRQYGIIAAVLSVLGLVIGGVGVLLALGGAGAIVGWLMAIALSLFLAAGPLMRRAKRSGEGAKPGGAR